MVLTARLVLVDAPPTCTDGKTKAITAEDTVPAGTVIRDGGVPSAPKTLPATEQWVGELWPDFAGDAVIHRMRRGLLNPSSHG